MSSIEITTNFKDSNNVDLGKKLITKDYLISVYPSIASKIGYTPDLWLWGRGGNGQLGNNSYTSVSTPITTFSGGTSWKQISSGTTQVAAIKVDGTLWVWGNNTNGILGNASVTASVTPITTFIGGTDWKYVNAGESITAAIKTDGTLWIWGNSSSGLCGNNSPFGIVSTPITTFTGGTNWKQVSCGKIHNAAIKTDGTLWLWGSQSGFNRILGTNGYQGFVSTPITTFAGGTTWADTSTANADDLYTLSISNDYAMAIKTDGTLWGWGNGRNIGGNLTSNTDAVTPITTFTGGTTWKELSLGTQHAAAIKTDGTLWLWGSPNSRLGDGGSTFSSQRYTPVTTFLGGTNWKQISSGFVHNVAVKTDGTLWTWGLQASDQLGIGFGTSRSTPVTTFAGGTTWSHVSAGYVHSSGIKTDGTLWLWGEGNTGRLGDARATTTTDRSTPITTFIGGTTWKQVSCGFDHTAAIKTDGTLWMWGGNGYGQLGNAVTAFRSTPITTFLGGTNWKQVASARRFTAAVKTDGTLWVWGNNNNGQLANRNVSSVVSTPVTTFMGGTSWKQVGSNNHSNSLIALRDTGSAKELFLSGDNSTVQLGNLLNNSFSPTPITTFTGGTNWKQVSCGNLHTAATKTDGTLWTWGTTTYGKLGNSDFSNSSYVTPSTTFLGGTNWNLVSTAFDHTAAIKTDGTLWLWGRNNYGQLGIGNLIDVSTPVTTFSGGTLWKTVNLGYRRSYSIKIDGTLWVWGNEYSGSLGNTQSSWTNKSTPTTTFLGGTYWKQVAASEFASGTVAAALRSSDFYD